MMSKKKRVCLLFAGGTIGMTADPESKALRPAENSLDVLRNIPELKEIVELGFEQIVNIDSSNLQPSHWTAISKRVYELYDDYDGFVVAHGTDTMAYTASALSFALEKLGKPVVFTGSLIPMNELGSDARNNLVYACMVASLDIAESCIVMANKILRGNRAKKHHESFVAAFHTPCYPLLGRLGRPIVLHEWRRSRQSEKPLLRADFDSKISLFKIFPGFDPLIIDQAIENGTHGIIIEGFGPGNLPFKDNSLLPSIEAAIQKEIPVIIGNQMEKGSTSLESYEAGLLVKEAGALSARDMTTEATVTKLMWALAQGENFSAIQNLMQNDLAGEISEGGRVKYYDAL